MRRDDGFTLIEVAIAVLIMMIVLMLAVPSINGVLADRRLRRSLDELNGLVRQAQAHSMAERRSYLIVWHDGGLALRPEGFLKRDDPSPVATVRVSKGESFKISFPAALADDPPAEWVFWPSGNCEPAVVKYRGANGGWTARYSALTTRAELTDYAAN